MARSRGMYPQPPCAVPHGTDLRLQPFLGAASTEEADLELATPWIVQAVRHCSRYGNVPDAADAASEARAQVIACLQRLRNGNGVSPEKRLPIADFETYVYAHNTWADTMRARDPQGAKLLNRWVFARPDHDYAVLLSGTHGQQADITVLPARPAASRRNGAANGTAAAVAGVRARPGT